VELYCNYNGRKLDLGGVRGYRRCSGKSKKVRKIGKREV